MRKKYLAYIYLDFCLPLFHIPNVCIYTYIYTRSITHIYKFLGKYRKYISNICQGKRNKYREIVKLVVNEAIHILEIQQMLNRKYEYTRLVLRQSSGYRKVPVSFLETSVVQRNVSSSSSSSLSLLSFQRLPCKFWRAMVGGKETWLGVGFRIDVRRPLESLPATCLHEARVIGRDEMIQKARGGDPWTRKSWIRRTYRRCKVAFDVALGDTRISKRDFFFLLLSLSLSRENT